MLYLTRSSKLEQSCSQLSYSYIYGVATYICNQEYGGCRAWGKNVYSSGAPDFRFMSMIFGLFGQNATCPKRRCPYNYPHETHRPHNLITPVLKHLHWLPVRDRIAFKVLVITYKSLHGMAPLYLSALTVPYPAVQGTTFAGTDASENHPIKDEIVRRPQFHSRQCPTVERASTTPPRISEPIIVQETSQSPSLQGILWTLNSLLYHVYTSISSHLYYVSCVLLYIT